MPTVSLKLGEQDISLGNAGDLLRLADPSQDAITFKIADTLLAAHEGKRLRDLDEVELSAGLGVESDSKWKVGGGNVTFGFDASTVGSVVIRKQGELLRHRLGQDEKDVRTVEVPAGHAYISVQLIVSLGVEGGAKFSHGALGVNAEASKNLKFTIANHKCVPLDQTVGNALRQSFESFELPFKTEGVEALDDQDYLEYEFIGKLALGFGINYGVSGLLLGGRSKGEIKRSFESPIGGAVVKAKPSFKAGAKFGVSYDHEDAFRVVVGRQKRPAEGVDAVTLFLFRMDQSKLGISFEVGISVSAGASVQFKLELDKVIDEAAKKLTEGLPGGPARDAAIKAFKDKLKKNDSRRELEKYVKEANARVKKLLSKLNNQKVELSILHERIEKDTSLFNFEFDLNEPNALQQGYPLAIQGRFFEAIQVAGVNLLEGSFVENEVVRRTTLKFQLFDLFRFVSITEYFRKTTIVYAGQGVFRLRYTSGVKHERGQVGQTGQVEVFFTADALTKDFETAFDLDVKLHFILNDRKRKAARQTAEALELIQSGSKLAEQAALLSEALEESPKLHVKVSCEFDDSAFENLTCDEFVDGKPQPLPHPADEKNWDAFVDAANIIHLGAGYKGEGFPDLVESFDQWALYNLTAIDREDSSKPPNRRQRGNTAVDSRWPSRWIGVNHSDRRFMFVYLDAGRRFMNLCDDLKHLASDFDDSETEERYLRLLKHLDNMIQDGISVWFTKSTLVALFRRTGSQAVDVEGPLEEEGIGEKFEVSFRAKA